MNKEAFLADEEVDSFLNWLARELPRLEIHLDIRRSRFVPSTVRVDIIGLPCVLNHYTWKSHGMATGDWGETRARLRSFAQALRNAVQRQCTPDVLDTCRHILQWGGNRNWNIGAYPFLEAKARAGSLWSYIEDTGAALELETADIDALVPSVELLNSMLTKVHALYADDGLPIYDSRVAAAIASLVETWRQATGRSGAQLPARLTFPATISSRTVHERFPHANAPGVMLYGAPNTTRQWASAKVRLGWAMECVLERQPELFSDCCVAPSLVDRMHAFEASLFVVGYDVTCLGGNKTNVHA